MSEFVKGKKVVNAIGIGIMAFLGSGTSLLQVSAAAVETEAMETVGETQETGTKESSQNQGTIDALNAAGGAIKGAQASVTGSEPILGETAVDIQGSLSGCAEALGAVNGAVGTLESNNKAAQQAVEDYNSAVAKDVYRDTMAENISDAKNKLEAADKAAADAEKSAAEAAEQNKAAQENTYGSASEAQAAKNEAQQKANDAQAALDEVNKQRLLRKLKLL